MSPPSKAGTGAGTGVPASFSTPSASTKPLTRQVRLVKRHIQAGLPKGPGEEIELLHDLADWLVAEGAAKEIEPAVDFTPAPSTAAAPAAASNPPSTPLPTPKKEK